MTFDISIYPNCEAMIMFQENNYQAFSALECAIVIGDLLDEHFYRMHNISSFDAAFPLFMLEQFEVGLEIDRRKRDKEIEAKNKEILVGEARIKLNSFFGNARFKTRNLKDDDDRFEAAKILWGDFIKTDVKDIMSLYDAVKSIPKDERNKASISNRRKLPKRFRAAV